MAQNKPSLLMYSFCSFLLSPAIAAASIFINIYIKIGFIGELLFKASMFAWVISILFLIILGPLALFSSGKNAILTRTMPEEIPPAIAATAAEAFDLTNFPTVDKGLPDIATGLGAFTKLFKNDEALREHLTYLNNIHQTAYNEFRKQYDRYKEHSKYFHRQQVALYRMACIAEDLSRKFGSRFPIRDADISEVPMATIPPPPPIPLILTVEKYHKTMNNVTRGTGQVTVRGFQQGGVAGGVAALAVSAAIGAKMHLSALQQLPIAQGEVEKTVQAARQILELLSVSTQQLVVASAEIHRQSTALESLIPAARLLLDKEAWTKKDKDVLLQLKQYALGPARNRAIMRV